MSIYRTSSPSQMKQLRPAMPVIVQDELWVAEQLRNVVYTLERAMASPPLQMTREVKAALRAMVRAREKIAEWLEEDPFSIDAANWRQTLERMDCAHGMIVGLDYPGIGSRRKPVERAREVLQSILAEGLL